MTRTYEDEMQQIRETRKEAVASCKASIRARFSRRLERNRSVALTINLNSRLMVEAVNELLQEYAVRVTHLLPTSVMIEPTDDWPEEGDGYDHTR